MLCHRRSESGAGRRQGRPRSAQGGAQVRVQGAGCRVQGAGCRVQGRQRERERAVLTFVGQEHSKIMPNVDALRKIGEAELNSGNALLRRCVITTNSNVQIYEEIYVLEQNVDTLIDQCCISVAHPGVLFFLGVHLKRERCRIFEPSLDAVSLRSDVKAR